MLTLGFKYTFTLDKNPCFSRIFVQMDIASCESLLTINSIIIYFPFPPPLW